MPTPPTYQDSLEQEPKEPVEATEPLPVAASFLSPQPWMTSVLGIG